MGNAQFGAGLSGWSLARFLQSLPAQVRLAGPRMDAHEKAYRQLISRGFCHLSISELDEYVRGARWRARVASALLVAAVLTYVFAIRPM